MTIESEDSCAKIDIKRYLVNDSDAVAEAAWVERVRAHLHQTPSPHLSLPHSCCPHPPSAKTLVSIKQVALL